MLRIIAIVTVSLTIQVAPTERALAGVTLYFDRAEFDLASGGGLSFDSFEGNPVAGVALSRAGYTVSEVNGSGNAIGTGPMGLRATNGLNAAQYVDDGLSILTFSFDRSINAFGFDISVDPGGRLVSVGGDLNESFSLPTASPTFFGVIDHASTFNTLTFGLSEGRGNVAFDSVSFGSGTVNAVPEPSTLALSLVGVALGLVVYRRTWTGLAS
jgi:hypothetical protein